METEIIEKEKVKLKNGVLITGLPGIGLIGQVVGRYITKELKAKRVATLYSHHFPHQVFMTKKGGMRLIKNTIYHYKGKKRDLLILIGDVQAMSSVGQYEVAEVILNYAKKCGVKKIITVGGYSTGKITDKKQIFAVATHKSVKGKFEKFGVIFGQSKGSIVGIAGLLPSLGKLRGFEGICLMGETHGGYVDAISARNIVKLLSDYFEIKIDLKRLDQRAKESEKMLKKIEDEIQKSMQAPYETPPQGVSYIR
jgi:uncharacterized protein (TIGR00162 family)